MTHTYEITGMTCNGCIAKVKSELLKIGDITQADLQLASPQATITMQKHIPTSVLQEALAQAGSKYRILELNTSMHHTMTASDDIATGDNYFPIILIFLYITGISLLLQLIQPVFNWMQWMSHFMAGFFLVFSFFKLMNLKGFAEGYRMYDVVAKAVPAYGFVYPFIELGLGLAFLTRFNPLMTNWIALVVMSVSIIGVIQNLMKKTPFQCACLGTVIKLPLSKVTLFEDALMIVMSAIMLLNM